MRAARWQSLELFAQVVDAGSISAAADHLGVAKSSVSTQIKSLEGELGIRLLSRSKSGVRATEPGLRMYEHAKRLLAHMDSAVEDVRAGESSPSGTLRISMPAGIADALLIPALGRFLQRYPKIRLDVQATDDLVELRQSGVDVALRFGWVRDGDFVAKKICQFRELLCASPAYLASQPTVAAPADLSRHRWIGFTGFGGVHQTIVMRDRARPTAPSERFLPRPNLECAVAEVLGAGRRRRDAPARIRDRRRAARRHASRSARGV